MLRRKVYDALMSWKERKDGKCLLVKGARQVGKTYIIDRFGKDNYENYLYVNLENDADAGMAFDGNLDVDRITQIFSGLYPKIRFIPGKTLIFLDEIQSCPRARTALKSFVIDGRYDVIASGSLLGIRYKDKPLIPVGYERIITMHSLDFEEYLWAVGYDDEFIGRIRTNIRTKTPFDNITLKTLSEHFRNFMIVGGMPRSVDVFLSSRNFGMAWEELNSIMESMNDDISAYSKLSDRNKIAACLRSIPIQLTKTNKKFVYADVMNEKTASSRKYEGNLLWLYDAGIINYCYNLGQVERPIKANYILDSFKIYVNDTGVLSSMYGDSNRISILKGDVSVNQGAVTENIVGELLMKSGYDLCYLKKKNIEVDFIVETKNGVYAIEVKSGRNRSSPSLDSMIDKGYKVDKRIKFEQGNIDTDKNGIEHYPLFASGFIGDIE